MNPTANHVVILPRNVAAPRLPNIDCISAPPNALDDSPSPLLSCKRMIRRQNNADRKRKALLQIQ